MTNIYIYIYIYMYSNFQKSIYKMVYCSDSKGQIQFWEILYFMLITVQYMRPIWIRVLQIDQNRLLYYFTLSKCQTILLKGKPLGAGKGLLNCTSKPEYNNTVYTVHYITVHIQYMYMYSILICDIYTVNLQIEIDFLDFYNTSNCCS